MSGDLVNAAAGLVYLETGRWGVYARHLDGREVIFCPTRALEAAAAIAARAGGADQAAMTLARLAGIARAYNEIGVTPDRVDTSHPLAPLKEPAP